MTGRQQPRVVAFLCACYALLLRLYPGSFRAEFEEEMKEVFAEAMAEAARRGRWPLLKTAGLEFGSLPALIVLEWRSHIRQKEHLMGQARLNLTPATGVGGGRGSWPAVLLAALPHFLLATTMALTAAFAGPAPSWFTALRYGMLAVLGVALLLAWRLGWPLWSGSWAGYWILFPFFWASSILPWRPGLDYLLMLPPVAIGLLLFLRRPLVGLLAIVAPMLFMTRLFAFELVAGGDWVWSGIWLLLGITAGAIVWRASVRAGVLLTVAFHFVAGLFITVARSYLPYRSPTGMSLGPRPTPQLATLVNDFVPLTLAAITLPLALLLLRPLGRLAGRGGKRSRRNHRLLLLGMAVTFGGVFALRARPSFLDGTSNTLAVVAVAVGLFLSLGAAVALIRVTWSGAGATWQDALLPLLSAFAPLVVFALARPFPTAGQYRDGFQVQVFLSYTGVLTWTLLAILTLVRRDGGRAQPEITMEAVPG